MKKLMLCITLLLCAALLCACGNTNKSRYEVVSRSTAAPQQNLYANAAVTDVPYAPDFNSGAYDPAWEEDEDEDYVDDEPMYVTSAAVTPAPTISSAYAGATPVIIDPIDKPTPTPIPPLAFTYDNYSASRLHLTFQGPSGWLADESLNDTYTLTSPDTRTGYAAFVTIRAISVNSTFKASELKTEIKQTLQTIRSDNGLKSFKTTGTANRAMLGKTGIYANYTGVTADGVKVAGRVHMVCIDKTVYLLHASYPQAYTDTYVEQVYHKVRDTLKTAK